MTVLMCRQILQNVVLQGKKLGKAVYVFSVDPGAQKVAHANHVPPSLKTKGVDARTWASKVSEVLGGKVSWLRLFLCFVSNVFCTGRREGRWCSGSWYECGASD